MRKASFLYLTVLLLLFVKPQSSFASKINILESLELYYSLHPKKAAFGDITPHKEIIDIPNGYYAQPFSYDPGKNMIPANLFEATIFRNTDKTTTLVVTEYNADEQCSWNVTTFFEISSDGKNIQEKDIANYIPKIEWKSVCKQDAIEVVKYYLPILKGSYLSENATFEELMKEFYSFQYKLPQIGTLIKVELNICDYIPNNEITIPVEKWETILNGTKAVFLKYNKKKKTFEFQ